MAYNIVFKKSVSRDLAKLRKEEARRILRQLEKDLSDNPGSYPVLKGKFAGLRKYRVRSHRVIYTILGRDVLVLRIGQRGEVYKQRNTRTLTRPRTSRSKSDT